MTRCLRVVAKRKNHKFLFNFKRSGEFPTKRIHSFNCTHFHCFFPSVESIFISCTINNSRWLDQQRPGQGHQQREHGASKLIVEMPRKRVPQLDEPDILHNRSDGWWALPLGRRTRGRLNELRDGYIDRHLLRAKEAIERDKKKLKRQFPRLFCMFNRDLFCSMDRWYALTLTPIRLIEDEAQQALDETDELATDDPSQEMNASNGTER
ncbi:hypothetical protein niasHT_001976 [Heterodera trifolii]|uniref:Phosphatidylinositol transfer protein N-terminal domain-containing protein n=1 Tax=Heterodera trifolii TaxID=157864 RepID=A0ABD2M4G7_9BILA